MSQTIIQSGTRQRIVTARIFKDAQGRHAMRLLLPHGLDFTKGVSLSIDGGNMSRHSINTADANGAYASVPLDDGLIAAMKAGNVVELGIANISGNNIKLNLSLDGFTANFALLDR